MIQKLITLSILISFLTYKINAQDGTLDLSFGTSGKVITKASASGWDIAYDIAIQSDQKIIVCGESPSTSKAMLVMRYNNDGTLDNSFDVDGKVLVDITTISDQANSLAIQLDGKILVVGSTFNTLGANQIIGLARLKSNGSLDSTFGINGIVKTEIGFTSQANSIVVQNDGKIVIAGYSDTSGMKSGVVVRYNSNGTIDNTFGNSGIFSIVFNSSSTPFNAVALQQDGKIVVSGHTANTPDEIFVARLLPNGSLDNAFGVGGFNHFALSTIGCKSYTLAINSQGKIIIGGFSLTSATLGEMVICQLDVTGNLDPSFGIGSSGYFKFSIGATDSYIKDLKIQSDDKILVAGTGKITGQGDNFVVAKIKPNGTLDSSFNLTGFATTDFNSGSNDYGNAMTIQADGKMLVTGDLFNSGDVDVALARYNNSSQSLSISEPINNSNFKIFPNPSNIEFTIVHSLDADKLVTIHNQTGQIVLQQKLHKNETKINTQHWEKGIYILTIEGISQKLIIQ